MTEIFLDENLSEHVADALNFLNKAYYPDINIQSTKTRFGKGTKDELIIPAIGKLKGVLITRDIQINQTRMQSALCKEHNLGVFFLKLPKGQNTHWELVKLLINNWQDMIHLIQKNQVPFSYEISLRGKIRKI